MEINEKLKFSWGHIIAFIAIVLISYVSFMGISYLTDGDFLLAGIGVFFIDVIIVVFFIGAQLMKSTDEKFKRRIVFERALVFAAPFVFCVVMIPYAHFWTVFDRRDDIESTFSSALERTKGMFDSYKSYAEVRIANYDKKLAKAQSRKISRDNKVNALRIQLVSDNFENLKKVSSEWIDRASESTVWNVFMLGNIHKIKDALESWNEQLTVMSQKIMSDEAQDVSPFTSEDPNVVQANQDLSNLNGLYSTMSAPNGLAILTGFILLLMLSLPYAIQHRNTKSTYRLLGTEKTNNKQTEERASKRIQLERPEVPSSELSSGEGAETGNYGSFRM